MMLATMSTKGGKPKKVVNKAFFRVGEMAINLVSQCLSAILHWTRSLQIRPKSQARCKLSVANNIWTDEDQNLGSQSTFDDTRCLDICTKLP